MTRPVLAGTYLGFRFTVAAGRVNARERSNP